MEWYYIALIAMGIFFTGAMIIDIVSEKVNEFLDK